MIKLPGYGRSSPLSIPHTKRNVGTAILSILHSLLHQSQTPHDIFLIGHDRGGRICHRLSVDAPTDPRFKIKGTVVLDILPATVQFHNASPQALVGFFHWTLLPNVELATEMINAFGGDKWSRTLIKRWQGQNQVGIKKLQENDAERIYGDAFKYEHVIRATCDDYRATADEEIKEHEDDQREGRKIDVDVLLLYSSDYLATRGNIAAWQDWMGTGKLELKGFGGGVGHFIAEEAPEKTADAIVTFYNGHI